MVECGSSCSIGSDLHVGFLLDLIGVVDCVEGGVDGGGVLSGGGDALKPIKGRDER